MSPPKSRKFLLINPSIYDLRFDWSRWHQPCGLLQIGKYLKAEGHDVRLIDCLQPIRGKRIQRTKLDTILVNDSIFQRWHFGWKWEQIEKRINELRAERWKPDAIYITSLMTFWWEAIRDLVTVLRNFYPRTRIVLGGVYPQYCLADAKKHFRGVKFDTEIGKKAKSKPTDFSLYDSVPHFAGLYLHRSRSANQLVNEIEEKSDSGVREFAFFDDEIPGTFTSRFEQVLDLIVERQLSIKLLVLGNLSPHALNANLVAKMRAAGYRQFYFRDDIALGANANADLGAYKKAVALLSEYGGYMPYTQDITAMVLVGVPGENLKNVVERIVHLSDIVGSVNLIPFQPTPGTSLYKQHQAYLDAIPLELQNGKLFPFAQYNGYTFADYQELIRLAALLNSKFHGTTFNFLGEEPIATMVRKSIAEESWRPRLRETLQLLPK